MSSQKNVVVLGASCAGLCVAHYLLKHIIPILNASHTSSKYHVVIVDPSSHFFWRPASPKAVVEPDLLPTSKLFVDLKEGFKQYDADTYTIRQAAATNMNTTDRTVTIKPTTPDDSGEPEMISYDTLVICTGIRTPTPWTSLHGDHHKSIASIQEYNKSLSNAKEIVLSGGGPIGVETAGVLGEKFNGTAGYFSSKISNPKVKITLVAGPTDRLLPVLNRTRAKRAEQLLNKVGVEVLYNASVDKVAKDEKTGKTVVSLSNGGTLNADTYLPCYGAQPNSDFVPAALRTEKGFVKTDYKTFKVEGAGDRVFCAGDVKSPSPAGITTLYEAIPVLMQNIALELGIERGQYLGEKTSGKHKEYVNTMGETQVVPVGRSGVGAFKGWSVPGVVIHLVKGRDFMVSRTGDFTHGNKWTKATW